MYLTIAIITSEVKKLVKTYILFIIIIIQVIHTHTHTHTLFKKVSAEEKRKVCLLVDPLSEATFYI